MDPEPTANPHAELVMEWFQERPALETSTQEWSPTTPPDSKSVRASGWCGAGEPAVFNEEDHFQESEIVDKLFDKGCEERNTTTSSRIRSAFLAGHDVNLIGQGQQTDVVGGEVKLDVVGGYTLPSLRELGLDVHLGRRYWNGK